MERFTSLSQNHIANQHQNWVGIVQADWFQLWDCVNWLQLPPPPALPEVFLLIEPFVTIHTTWNHTKGASNYVNIVVLLLLVPREHPCKHCVLWHLASCPRWGRGGWGQHQHQHHLLFFFTPGSLQCQRKPQHCKLVVGEHAHVVCGGEGRSVALQTACAYSSERTLWC